MNLFVNYFDHKNPERKKEIDLCFENNQANELIKRIIVVNRGERATYGDFFKVMQDYPKDVNIIANSDIYFDETIKLADRIRKKQCFALTRWEKHKGKVIDFNERHGRPSPPQWSQDAWIFRGSIKHDDFNEVVAVNLKSRLSEYINFHLGIPGCDNKLAAMLKEKGLTVTNPSLSIKAIHVHRNSSRVYPHYQILKGIKPFGLVHQTSL